MKTYGGSGDIAPHILNVGTRWRWSASRPSRFIPEKEPPVPTGYEAALLEG
jgi:hypothetical protein